MTDTPTTQQAIQASLEGKWDEAILINKALLKENPQDIDALNRLAFAHTVLGQIQEARTAYNKVLKLDKANPIALKNSKRLGDTSRRNNVVPFSLSQDMFLEEVGKTKMVNLINPAPPRILRTLQVGQSVNLVVKRLKIFVLSESEQFLGMLPDDLSRRLIKFMDGGNEYKAYVREVDDKEPCIFIKEVKRSARYKNQPSFNDIDTSKPLTISRHKDQDDDEDLAEEE